MSSQVHKVRDYLKTAPREHQVVLGQLRVFCRALLAAHDESLRFGRPTYAKYSSAEIAFASSADGILFFVLRKDVAEAFQSELSDVGLSCIRFSRPGEVDFNLVERILVMTASRPPAARV